MMKENYWGETIMPERNVKFQYFGMIRQVKEKNKWKGKGKLNIETWMDKLDIKGLLNATVDLGDTKASLDRVEWDKAQNVWVFRFMKLREDNIPSIVKENQEAEAFPLGDDEYIGEGLHMLYDNNTGIAMVQMNRFSLGLKRLEKFLTQIWEIENERIRLRPFLDDVNFDQAIRRKYKAFEVEFANIGQAELDERSSLSTIMSYFQKFYGVTGSIKISLGRKKADTLNIEEVNRVITDALDDDNVSGLKLRVKDDDQRPVEEIDLFDNICKDIINFRFVAKTALSFEYVKASMVRRYEDRKDYLVRLMTPRH